MPQIALPIVGTLLISNRLKSRVCVRVHTWADNARRPNNACLSTASRTNKLPFREHISVLNFFSFSHFYVGGVIKRGTEDARQMPTRERRRVFRSLSNFAPNFPVYFITPRCLSRDEKTPVDNDSSPCAGMNRTQFRLRDTAKSRWR